MRQAYSYRRDPGVPPFPDDRPIMVYDGHCALCSGWVKFLLRHDRGAKYRLLAAQSSLGHAIYEHYALDPEDYETNILIADGMASFKSEACIRTAEGLGFPWSLAAVFRILPLRMRDACYEFIARNRMRFFGRHATCFLPSEEYKNRFLG
jgi:predicted DCC family thiol-disulfide oxidoreductase YuxK